MSREDSKEVWGPSGKENTEKSSPYQHTSVCASAHKYLLIAQAWLLQWTAPTVRWHRQSHKEGTQSMLCHWKRPNSQKCFIYQPADWSIEESIVTVIVGRASVNCSIQEQYWPIRSRTTLIDTIPSEFQAHPSKIEANFFKIWGKHTQLYKQGTHVISNDILDLGTEVLHDLIVVFVPALHDSIICRPHD